MPPVTKCDTVSRVQRNFDWLFTPSASDMSDSALQRSEYCDNSSYTFSAPHSYSRKLTTKTVQNKEDTPDMHHSTCRNSSSSLPNTGQVSEEWPAKSNTFPAINHNANLFHCKDEFAKPLERLSESSITAPVPTPLELKPEIHRKEEKLLIGNNTTKFLYQMGMSIIGRRKHVLSNFDMNAISPTSW